MIDVLEQLNLDMPSERIAEAGQKGVNVIMPFEVVSFWLKDEDKEAEEEEVIITIEIYDPSGKKLNSFDQNIKIPAIHQRIRVRSHFNGLSIFDSGIHHVKVKVREEAKEEKLRVVANLPLDVRFSIPINSNK